MERWRRDPAGRPLPGRGSALRSEPRVWRGIALTLLACAVLLGGCDLDRAWRIVIENDLGEPVEIVYLADPEFVAGRLGTGERDRAVDFDFGLKRAPGAAPGTGPCTTADIVARALDGRVLARIPPPVCEISILSLSAFSVDRPLRSGIWIINDLGEPVEIVYLAEPEVVAGRLGTEEGDDREVFDFGLKPNPSAAPGETPCTITDIVARALDGRVLARIPPPACEGGTAIGLKRFRVFPKPTGDATPSPTSSARVSAALYRQLGLAPALGIELTADPVQIVVPRTTQYLSGLSDIRLSNHTHERTWITPNETAFAWRGSDWEAIGCGEGSPSPAEDRLGFCDAALIPNELPAGAVWTSDSEPASFSITWPQAPVGPGIYAFVLPVWDSELAAERQPPRTAAVLVVELVERP